MIWWAIPTVATLAGWLWTRRRATSSPALRPRPEPGSAEDLAELARFASALSRPLPDHAG